MWSLDDYHFLVFVVGASQLKQHSYITPKSARSRHLVSDHAEQYLYMRAIEKLLRTKSGLFEEHSPMLYDICGMPSWDEVCDGLIRMWEGEVLGKFPVAQHFLFCEDLPASWAAPDGSPPASLPVPRGPAALRGFKPAASTHFPSILSEETVQMRALLTRSS